MKSFGKLFSIVIVALMTFAMFTSCSRDDEENFNNSSGNISSLIVGSWDSWKEECIKVIISANRYHCSG